MPDAHYHYLQTETPLVTSSLKLDDQYYNQCIETAYELGDSQNKSTNVKSYSMTDYRVWTQTNIYNKILDQIMDIACNKAWRITRIPNENDNEALTIVNAWVAIYKSGDYCVEHHHGRSSISFVYYLKTDDNSSPLIFPRSNWSFHPSEKENLIFFGGYLPHAVSPHPDNAEDRIVLAGNMDIVSLDKLKTSGVYVD